MTLASRRERVFSQVPQILNGYELNPEQGYFSVVLPEATTNLVTNPSFEGNVTTGYAAYGAGAAIAAVATWQAYGVYGLRMTPAASVECGAYYGTIALTSGTTYTASVTIQGEAGKIYYIWFATDAGALLGVKRMWIGNGHKQRIHITYTETASANRRVYVTRDSRYADTNVFYMDGLQVEAKAYPTTFCDGDQTGFLINEVAYYWNGTPRASTSSRSAQTRAGGREMNLLSYGLRILAVIGLGMIPLVDQALAIPGFGELPQGTGTQAREFTLVGNLFANADNPRLLMAQRDDLVDAFKPDLVTRDQPMILTFQACDDEGEALGDKVEMVCKYRGGLEGNWDNHQGERLALNFKQYMPYVRGAWDSGGTLGYQTTVADSDFILMRDNTGLWQELADGTNSTVRAIAKSPNGTYYAGGTFTLAGGVANTAYIAQWNGTAWSALATGMNQFVYAIAIAPDGTLYAGGDFTLASGVLNTAYIAKWDGANWTALGTGLNGTCYALAIGNDGSLYAGGTFTLAGGVANTVRIAKWDGSVWTPLSTGANNTVYALSVARNGDLYVGGLFTTIGGVACNYIAKWNGTAFNSLSSGMSGGVPAVYALTFIPSGNLIAAGDFTAAGGVSASNIAEWNGAAWQPLSTGVNVAARALFPTRDGRVYVGGFFTTAGGITLPDRMAIWNGTTWTPFDIDLPGNPIVYAILENEIANSLFIGFDTTGNSISATVTVPNVGSATAYPKITFTGPGTVWQLKNYTTGKAIYFNLTLLAGETAVLNLDPMNLSFVSSFRGNILNTILPGSDLNFELLPGSNNVSSYMYGGTTAASAIVMSWRDQYWSLDGAAWK